jgi:hypothetical protein
MSRPRCIGTTPPTWDYPFYAAHRLAMDEWRSWTTAAGEAARRAAEVRETAAREGPEETGRGRTEVVMGQRRAFGAAHIAVGQRVRRVPTVATGRGSATVAAIESEYDPVP